VEQGLLGFGTLDPPRPKEDSSLDGSRLSNGFSDNDQEAGDSDDGGSVV